MSDLTFFWSFSCRIQPMYKLHYMLLRGILVSIIAYYVILSSLQYKVFRNSWQE